MNNEGREDSLIDNQSYFPDYINMHALRAEHKNSVG